MLDFNWSNPYRFSGLWRRECIIPTNLINSFFNYWKPNKFKLLNDGFSVGKIKEQWAVFQTKPTIDLFSTIVDRESPEIEVPLIQLPEYTLKHTDILKPWQVDAVSKLVPSIKQWNAAVDGSEMGVGKTFSSIGTVRELNVPFVIVCPKAVIPQWNEVVDDFFKIRHLCKGIINYERLIRGRKDCSIASFVLKRELKRHKFIWKLPSNSIIIWDEAHKLKNYKTKTSKCCLEAFHQGYTQLFLSATIATSPLDLKTIGICLKMFKNGKTYYDWANKHGVSKGTWGLEFNNDKEALKKINRYLFEERGVRKRRDEIPNFPECEFIVQAYTLDEDKVASINENFKKMLNELSRLDGLLENEETQIVIRLRYRQRIELLKVDLFVELTKEAIDAGMSVLLFINYTETINVLSERLNTTCIYSGQVSEKEKLKNKEDFQSNKTNIFLIQVKSGGVGLNLGDLDGSHPRCSIVSVDDDSRAIKQCFGRAWRQNSKSKSLVKIPFVADSIEEAVFNNMKLKINNIDLINDSDLRIK